MALHGSNGAYAAQPDAGTSYAYANGGPAPWTGNSGQSPETPDGSGRMASDEELDDGAYEDDGGPTKKARVGADGRAKQTRGSKACLPVRSSDADG
jgi:hypothetical protein